MAEFAYIIIGGGMAGASAGYELSAHGPVVVLERESQPGYHTTGRSAAVYSEAYGNATIRALTTGGRGFFMDPPAGFSDHPILTPRGAMFVGRDDQVTALDRTAEETSSLVKTIRRIDAAEVLATVPALRSDYVAGGVLEPDAMDIDVNGLHQGFLGGLAARSGSVVTNADVQAVERAGGLWRLTTSAGEFSAPILLNAAGAWCDKLAEMAGAKPIGLIPKRRTAITFDPPADTDISAWPAVVDVDEQFYFKPDADQLMGSPADETPSEPCDAQPEEIDIAIAVDRIEKATEFKIGRLNSRWAGLRSFVADKTPVIGYDAAVAGFFWVAGQGGYGIQTAPSLGRVVSSLVTDRGIPSDLQDLGVEQAAMDPARCQAA